MEAWVQTMRRTGGIIARAMDRLVGLFKVPEALADFLIAEDRRTQVWMAYARFAVVGVFLLFTLLSWPDFNTPEELAYDLWTTLIFVPAGVIQLLAARSKRSHRWLKYVVITADVWMLTALVTTVPSFQAEPGSVQATEAMIRTYRNQDLFLIYILYAWVLISQSARFVAYFGLLVWIAWIAHLIGVLIQPGVFTMDNPPEMLQGAARAVIERDTRYVDPDIAGSHLSITFVLTLGFIVVIRRTRNLTARLFRSEQSRTALSRYFSPDVVERVLTVRDAGLLGNRRDTVILFADLVDFTRQAEALPPDQVFELLREFHGVMESQVFAHSGTLEKYIGDAVLATFGGLEGGGDDAARAMACAVDLQDAMGKLNRRRVERGAPPLELAIGLHYGPTVSGVIGEGRNMAFVVTGASVAIANRVQAEARRLNADIVISEDFARRCRSEGNCEPRMADFELEASCRLKGLSQPLSLWYRPRMRAVESAANC